MSLPSSILWDYLVDTLALFTNPSDGSTWPLYDGSLPDGLGALNTCAAIFNTSGVMKGKSMRSNLDQHYGIQIRIRSMTESDGYTKAKEVQDAFVSVHNQNISIVSGETWRINNLQQTTPIVLIGVDEKLRFNHTINFL